MREIKFRAWDNECEVMVYSDGRHKCAHEVNYYFFTNVGGKLECCWEKHYDDSLGYPQTHGEILDNIMQFSTISDAESNEIYVDDVLKTEVGNAIVWFGEIPSSNSNLRNTGFYLKFVNKKKNDYFRNDILFWVQEGAVVIGNIHDNPELLEVE